MLISRYVIAEIPEEAAAVANTTQLAIKGTKISALAPKSGQSRSRAIALTPTAKRLNRTSILAYPASYKQPESKPTLLYMGLVDFLQPET